VGAPTYNTETLAAYVHPIRHETDASGPTAVLVASPVATFDLDIVDRRTGDQLWL
jgi:hypothetical protein